jgi:flagellar basal body-associated protein FliL
MAIAAKAQGKAGGTRLSIGFFVIAVLLLGFGGWFWSTARAGQGVSAGSRQGKSSLHLETFVLNLADRDQRSYLRVGIDLGLGRAPGKGEDAPPVGPVRDCILDVLSQAKVDDLGTAAGKAKLKQDVLHALQERVPELEVQDVFFTEFLIQR